LNRHLKTFDELTNRELYEILRARMAVFCVEQDCPYQDMDGRDYESLHLFYTDGEGKVLACLRVFWRDKEAGQAQIGRVLTTQRGIGLGSKILNEGVAICRDQMQAKSIYLEAQVYAIGYYEKSGFHVASEEFLEDGIPHVKMEQKL